MITTLLLLSAALAGEVVVDAKVPLRLAIDGELAAEVYIPGTLRVPMEPGEHVLVVTTGGSPSRHAITVGSQPVVLLVGRTGISVGGVDPDPSTSGVPGPQAVEFRTIGRERLLISVGDHRVVVPPGDGLSLDLAPGDYPMSVRNPDGTQIFARGVLVVSLDGEGRVVQLSEGRIPETAGRGVAFDPTGR